MSTSFLEPLARERQRRRRIIDRVAVRRQEQVGRFPFQHPARDMRRRMPLHFRCTTTASPRATTPFRRVEEVARERDAPALDVDEVRDGARRVPGRRQRVYVEAAEALQRYSGTTPVTGTWSRIENRSCRRS